jgi:pyruvate,water dikinase
VFTKTPPPRVPKTLWSHVLSFLEIVGLREERASSYEDVIKEIKLRYFHFRDLLSANHELLEIISEIEVRLAEGSGSAEFARTKVLAALICAHRMASAFDALSSGRFSVVHAALGRIQQRISACLSVPDSEARDEIVVPLDRISQYRAGAVGNKMAVLGEIRNNLGLPVPEGFAVTVSASSRLFHSLTCDIPPPPEGQARHTSEKLAEETAARMRQSLLDKPVPEEVARAIRTACRALATGGGPLRLAVRSSAVDEDSESSFAGQYTTELNVTEERALDAFKLVLASAFDPEILFYRRTLGLDETGLAVGVGFMAMVDAVASGVAFSKDPVPGRGDNVLIHAAWGLGPGIADGIVDPDIYLVSRADGQRVVHNPAFSQKTRIVNLAEGGVGEEEIPGETGAQGCLQAQEIETLAAWANKLEEHFGGSQDIEWAMDARRRLFVLQSRPSTMAHGDPALPDVIPEAAELLLAAGETASGGIGCGPVFLIDSPEKILAFPEGGVLVAHHSSAKLVRAMKKASAIVTDVGSSIGHMASLSREFSVPTIVGAVNATSLLKVGETVTVDATGRRIYSGRVESLLERATMQQEKKPRKGAKSVLSEVSRYVVPLSLTDPESHSFTLLNCTSLHDLARYIHEKSFQEMFGIGQLVGDCRRDTPMLDIFLPIDLYIIDLGGGLDESARGRKVKKSQIISPPFAAMVKGMLHKDIPRFGPRGIDAKGLLHVVMRQAFSDPEWDRTLRDPCYAIISDSYVNLAARVGFHFSAVDAYCTDSINQNYITFRFKGGAADEVRRVRRVRAISRILLNLGFTSTVTGDLVAAQFLKREKKEILGTLEMLGRLLQFMRQMDAAMASDLVMEQTIADFLHAHSVREP